MDTGRTESLTRLRNVFSNSPFRYGEFLFVFSWACAFIVWDVVLAVEYFEQLPILFFTLLLFVGFFCVGVPLYVSLKVYRTIRELSSRGEFPEVESNDSTAAALRGLYMVTNLVYFFFVWGMAILLYFVFLTLSRSGGQPFPPQIKP